MLFDRIEINEYVKEESIISPIYSNEEKSTVLKYIEADVRPDGGEL